MHVHLGAELLMLGSVVLITLIELDIHAIYLAEFTYSHPIVREKKEHLGSGKGIPVVLRILLRLMPQPLTDTPSE